MLWAFPFYCLLLSGSSKLNHRQGFGDLAHSSTRKDWNQWCFNMNSSTRQHDFFSYKAKTYSEDFYHPWANAFSGSCCFLPLATVDKFLLVHWWLLWKRNGKHGEEFVPAGCWDSWGAPDSLESRLMHGGRFLRGVLIASPFRHLWGI